jgi:GAF domain-containing protein
MTSDSFLADLERLAHEGHWDRVLAHVIGRLSADSGTLHLLGADGVLHLTAASPGIPQAVLDTVRTVPVGKGMAGLAVERGRPVDACNIQTDTTGDVRPGARATGLQGSVVVPVLRDGVAVGALGVANRHERTFTEAERHLLMAIGRTIARGAGGSSAASKP